MGNCCRTASSTVHLGGEDWSFLGSKKSNKKKSSRKVFDFDEMKLTKEDLLMGELSAFSSCSDDRANGKIRIKMKITKKELEILLGEIEKQKQNLNQKQHGKVLSAEQVLVRLMKAREHHRTDHHTPWSPELESIPEVN